MPDTNIFCRLVEETATVRPMPPRLRWLLLEALDAAYPEGAPQRQLRDAPDAAVAWQVQSCLDDYADFGAVVEAQ